MKGDIGVFYHGNIQIGGCLNWEISIEIIEGINNTKKGINWKAKANTFWFYEKYEKVLACFFWVKNGQIILAYKGELTVNTPIKEYNKKQIGYLELIKENTRYEWH